MVDPTIPANEKGKITLYGDDLVIALYEDVDLVIDGDMHSDIKTAQWHAASVASRSSAGVQFYFPEFSPSELGKFEDARKQLRTAKTPEDIRHIYSNTFRMKHVMIEEPDKSIMSAALLTEYLALKNADIHVIATDTESKYSAEQLTLIEVYEQMEPVILQRSRLEQERDYDIRKFQELEGNDTEWPEDLQIKVDEYNIKIDELIQEEEAILKEHNDKVAREEINYHMADIVLENMLERTGSVFKGNQKVGIDHIVNFGHNRIDLDDYYEDQGLKIRTIMHFDTEDKLNAFVDDIRRGFLIDPPDVLILNNEGYGHERSYLTKAYIEYLDNNNTPIAWIGDADKSAYLESIKTDFERNRDVLDRIILKQKPDLFEAEGIDRGMVETKLLMAIKEAYENDGVYRLEELEDSILPTLEAYNSGFSEQESQIRVQFEENTQSLIFTVGEEQVKFESRPSSSVPKVSN